MITLQLVQRKRRHDIQMDNIIRSDIIPAQRKDATDIPERLSHRNTRKIITASLHSATTEEQSSFTSDKPELFKASVPAEVDGENRFVFSRYRLLQIIDYIKKMY